MFFVVVFFFFSSENSGVMWSNKGSIHYGNETYSVGIVFLQSPNGGVHNWPQKLKFGLHGVQHFALLTLRLKKTPLERKETVEIKKWLTCLCLDVMFRWSWNLHNSYKNMPSFIYFIYSFFFFFVFKNNRLF